MSYPSTTIHGTLKAAITQRKPSRFCTSKTILHNDCLKHSPQPGRPFFETPNTASRLTTHNFLQRAKVSGTHTEMTDSVVVGVRVRPLNNRETNASGTRHAWSVHSNCITASSTSPSRPPHQFLYDSVFDPRTTNDEIYHSLATPIIEAALGGFNATIFAYGQTSSGKTHTMLGDTQDPGLTPLAIRHVLRTVTASKTRQYLVRVAYVEIYNDKIRDLMNPQHGDLAVREDKAGRVFVDAGETIVESYDDAIRVLEKGQAARHVGETKMNSRSSRSHTIFTLHIESKGGDGVDQSFRASSLNLVDLAGSERLKSTGAEGVRQKEGAHINKSLLVLGTIINRLSSCNGDLKKTGHLPYRDSKLTRLLRPALGGNAKTAVLCTITPAAAHTEETLSTLKFAERAKKVTNNAVRNEVVDYRSKYKEAAVELALLKERFLTMERELTSMRNGGTPEDDEQNIDSTGSSFTDMSTSTSSITPAVGSIQFDRGQEAAKAIALAVELQASKEDVKYLKEHVDEVETENEHLRERLRMKTAEFRGLRSRAVELRSSARRARGNEKAVRRALVLCFKKLEQAREQLDISRKKGSHVKIAEGHLETLSDSLKSWLPGSVMSDLGSTESLTPPCSEAQEADNGLRRESNASEISLGTDTRGGSMSHLGNTDGLNDGSISRRPGQTVRRRPRPLPEDMVADIDDSETETDHPMPNDEELKDDEEFLEEELTPVEFTISSSANKVRISDGSADLPSAEKPKKKPKGWKAFKNFYGYGYTQRGVYDKMVAGHKVPATASNIST